MLNNMNNKLVTPFEKKVIVCVQQSMKALREKGYDPTQSLRIITQGEPPPVLTNLTWALAEAILFIEINRLYARTKNSNTINFLEATQFVNDDPSDDDIPF